MGSEIVNRIRGLMDEKSITQKDLIEHLGENQSAVAKWISQNEKNRRDIPNTIIVKIASYLDTTVEFLVTGESAAIEPTKKAITSDSFNDLSKAKKLALLKEFVKNPTPEASNIIKEATDHTPVNSLQIPVPNFVAGAGDGGYIEENLEIVDHKEVDISFLPKKAKREKLMATQIRGRSMMPEFNSGEWVIVERIPLEERDFLEFDDDYYLILYDDKYQVKLLEFLGRSAVNIISKNKDFQTKQHMFTEQNQVQFQIVGKVVAHIRTFDTVSSMR